MRGQSARQGGGGSGSALTPTNLLLAVLFGLVIVETFLVTHYRTLYMHSKYTQALAGSHGGGGGAVRQERVVLLGGVAPVQQQQVQQQQAGSSATATAAAAGCPTAAATGQQQQQRQVPAVVWLGATDEEGLPWLVTNETLRKSIDRWERAPNGTYLKSTAFAPLRISVCTHRMPDHYAPCLARRLAPAVDFDYAEEVMYPAHKVRLPGFVNNADRQRWVDVLATRGLEVKEDNQHVPFHVSGQNYVIKNVRYTDTPYPDNWNGDNTHCLGWNNDVAPLRSSKAEPGDVELGELLLANTPQSWSFQHFTDHVFKIIVQSMHLVTPETWAVTSAAAGDTVKEIWTWFRPVNSSRIIYGKAPAYHVGKLIHACRTPFWHPYMVQRWQEMALGPDAPFVPMAARKVVLYYTRSAPDARIHNGGRRVLNEQALLDAIKKLLAERNQGETLRVLSIGDFKSYRDLAVFMNQNVRAFIGPHGGGLENCIWLAMNTLMIEFQHHQHINYAMWELSPLLEHNYWVLTYPPVAGTDMNVNVADVVQVLSQQLGREEPQGTYVSHDYDWAKALKGGRRRRS